MNQGGLRRSCINCAHIGYTSIHQETADVYESGGFTCEKLHYNGEQRCFDEREFRRLFSFARDCPDYAHIEPEE